MARVPALVFEVDGQRYGLDVTQISELLPYVHLRRLPQVPEYVTGVFRYRDTMVPVIDMSHLISGKPAAALLSTRIILVPYTGPAGTSRFLGLLAERASQILEIDTAELKTSGVAVPDAPYLGSLSANGGSIIQYVKVEQLLPDDLRERLFVEE